MVKLGIAIERAQVVLYYLDALSPLRHCDIATRLLCSCLNDIYGHNTCLSATLRRHQGYKTRTSASIEDMTRLGYIGPRTQQNAIGAYLHSRQAIFNTEMLKAKHIVAIVVTQGGP